MMITSRVRAIFAKEAISCPPASWMRLLLCLFVVSPIICEGDAIGAVILFSKDAKVKMGEVEQKVAMSAAGFLGRQMEQ